MTQQERNQQIALMLGMKLDESQLSMPHTHYTCYHSDWNWLMEAVEFIENKGYRVAIQDKCCQVVDNDAFYNEEVEASTKIEAVFIAVSDFAKLYNEKKL